MKICVFKPSLIFANKAEAYTSRMPIKCGVMSVGITQNYLTKLNVLLGAYILSNFKIYYMESKKKERTNNYVAKKHLFQLKYHYFRLNFAWNSSYIIGHISRMKRLESRINPSLLLSYILQYIKN